MRKIVPKISWKNMLLVVTLRQFTIFTFIIVGYVFWLSKGHSEKHSKRQKPKKLACPYHQKDFHVSLTAACRTFAKKRSENFRSNSKAESTATFVYSRKSIPDPNYLCESYRSTVRHMRRLVGGVCSHFGIRSVLSYLNKDIEIPAMYNLDHWRTLGK